MPAPLATPDVPPPTPHPHPHPHPRFRDADLRWDDGTWLLGGGIRHAMARTRVSEGDETATDGYTLLYRVRF